MRMFSAARLGFTTRARCLLAGGITAALCGVLFGAVDLVRAGCLVVAVPIVAAVVVNRSQVTIASRRAADPARSTVGEDVGVQLTVTNRALLPTGALMLEDRLPDGLSGRARFSLDGLNRRESRTVAYRIPSLRRGRYVAGPLRVRLTDPFGLIDATRSFTATSTLLVTPVVERLPDVALPNSWDVGDNAGSHAIGSRGADDASTREYRYGDDLRKIHWRSTARIGSLMVRHEERPWQGHVTLMLDLRATAHESSTPPAGTPLSDARATNSLEWAISAAATIGHDLILNGRELSLISDASGGQRTRFPSPAALVDHLAEVGPSTDRDLSPLMPALRAAGRDSTIVAVLGQLDDASVHAMAEAHPRGSAAPAFAIMLQSRTWLAAGGAYPSDTSDTSDTRERTAAREAEILRAAGWWVVTASAGETISGIWLRLLSHRAYAVGGSSAMTGPRAGFVAP